MYAYPQISDVLAVIPVVTPILRGGKVATADAAQACWVVAGYGLSMALPSTGAAKALSRKVSRKQAADLLEGLCAGAPDGAQAAAAGLPWVTIAKLLLKLLLESGVL